MIKLKTILVFSLIFNLAIVFCDSLQMRQSKITEKLKRLILKPIISLSKVKAPNRILCKICQSTVKPINLLLKNNYGVSITEDIVILVCSIFLQFEECKTLISQFFPLMVESVIDRIINPDYICSKLLMCSNFHFKTLNPDDYARKLLNETKVYRNQTHEISKEIKILQIADLHIDSEYEEVIKCVIKGFRWELWTYMLL